MAPQTQSAGPFTAVVTGASGFVPGEVVKQLLSKGWNVSVASLPLVHLLFARPMYMRVSLPSGNGRFVVRSDP